MVVESFYRFLLADDQSINVYRLGERPSLTDISRFLFIKERSQNITLPDHYYSLDFNSKVKNIKSVGGLVARSLDEISEEYLYLDHQSNSIHIHEKKFNSWQNLVTLIPPLVLHSSVYFKNNLLRDFKNRSELNSLFNSYIVPNAKFTALPSPLIEDFEDVDFSPNKFSDLHVHLNGATETDVIWQNFLQYPYKIYKDLKTSAKNPKIKEQLEQEIPLLNPYTFYQFLKFARRLRHVFFKMIYSGISHQSFTITLNRSVLANVSDTDMLGGKHPFRFLIFPSGNYPPNLPYRWDMCIESLMYTIILSYLKKEDNTVLASLFHFYLQILGLGNRLLVQQLHQYGFEQFQKHTLNKLREETEKNYRNRFFQMHGNVTNNLFQLEGRFSPQKQFIENDYLISAIHVGWNKFTDHLQQAHKRVPELRLVAHFIKKKETRKDKWIRHKELRLELWQKKKSLRKIIDERKYNITGIDAAASEFDTAPEVFSPVFRHIRKEGFIRHFTFHVGEDFFHILSGLRAIYEAVEFNELQKGDRIGHATACGIYIANWINIVGEKIQIKRGEYFDNLVFQYYFILNHCSHQQADVLPQLKQSIFYEANLLYNGYYDFDSLIQSWLYRKYCPIHLLANSITEINDHSNFSMSEWVTVSRLTFFRDTKELIEKYHNIIYRSRYDEVITIPTEGVIKMAEIEMLQKTMLGFLCKEEIIIETLPTSNVRISHNKDFSSYHLWQWKEWMNTKDVPKIVVGTDDTGIFATNIYNEHAHIYCYLIHEKQEAKIQAIKFIYQLNDNGNSSFFK